MGRYAFPAFVLLSAVAVALLVFAFTGSTTPPRLLSPESYTTASGEAFAFHSLERQNWLFIAETHGCGESAPPITASLTLPANSPVVALVAQGRAVPGATVSLPLISSARETIIHTLLGSRTRDDSTCHVWLAVFDRAGRHVAVWRAEIATVDRALDELLPQLLLQERLSRRPRFHATLNGTCAGLLLIGFLFIRKRWIVAHVTTMLLATGTSLLFLVSYLDYHRQVGSMPFLGSGWSRPAYFSVLLTHTILAALLPPLVAGLLWFAVRKQFDRHRKLARWTFPVWLYVSITGVLIYTMLYVTP